MERAGFRPLPSLHNFLRTPKWLPALMSSVTPSNHLRKGILENLGEGLWWSWLLGPLCPVSPPGASTLHAHCLGHLPRPLHSQRPRGTHISCMSSSKGFNSSLCPPHPHCPCHRVGEIPPAQRGLGSCPESRSRVSPKHLGVRGSRAGLCPPTPLPAPGVCRVMGDFFRTREPDECSWSPKVAPHWFAVLSALPATFGGLNNFFFFLFLTDNSFLAFIHQVSEVLGELLFHLLAQPLQGSGAEVSSGRE